MQTLHRKKGQGRTYAIGSIVSIQSDQDDVEDYAFIGLVVKTITDPEKGYRMKVRLTSRIDPFAWYTRHDERVPNRWIDNWPCIVRIIEATVSQREEFCRMVPLDEQARLIESETSAAATHATE